MYSLGVVPGSDWSELPGAGLLPVVELGVTDTGPRKEWAIGESMVGDALGAMVGIGEEMGKGGGLNLPSSCSASRVDVVCCAGLNGGGWNWGRRGGVDGSGGRVGG